MSHVDYAARAERELEYANAQLSEVREAAFTLMNLKRPKYAISGDTEAFTTPLATEWPAVEETLAHLKGVAHEWESYIVHLKAFMEGGFTSKGREE